MVAYALVNATLIDGTEGMKANPGMTVVVDDAGIIVEIGRTKDVSVAQKSHVIDLKGSYLLPGLINAHVHLCGNGKPHSAKAAKAMIERAVGNPIGRAYLKRRVRQSAQAQLASGVTTIRTMGDPGYADVDLRNDVNAGLVQGPRILAAGTGITVAGGHGVGLFAQTARTQDQARALVRECATRKCDVIKLFVTGGVFDAEKEGEAGALKMPPELIKAACEEARALGMPTAAHAESTDGVKAALAAGVDTIEHGAPLTPALVSLFRSNGLQRPSCLVCTISPAIPFAKLPSTKTCSGKAQKANARIVYDGIVEAARTALEAGLPVGLGTDSSCPYVTHYDMWREVVYFQKHMGVSAEFALHAATLGNARVLGVDNKTGSIELGKSGDMIVLDENPLEDLCALKHVKAVMMRGKPVSDLKVKRMPEMDHELDGLMALVSSSVSPCKPRP